MLYLCEDCVQVFQLHSRINKPGKRVIYCPSCGDNLEVVEYKPERMGNGKVKIKWTDEEIKLLKRVKRGTLDPHQVAIMTGRTINAVLKKLERTTHR